MTWPFENMRFLLLSARASTQTFSKSSFSSLPLPIHSCLEQLLLLQAQQAVRIQRDVTEVDSKGTIVSVLFLFSRCSETKLMLRIQKIKKSVLGIQHGASSYQKDRNAFEITGGTSLTVQWLRLHASTPGSMGSIPGQGTKIPHAIWHTQKINKT